MTDTGWIWEIAAVILAAVTAITLHEAAHGYAAKWLGDDTAERMGRLSLNPIRHVDPVGTLLVPGMLLVSQLLAIGRVEAMFGWAKPVPVDILRLRSPRWGMVLVAAAGPGINFALAWGVGLAVHGLPWVYESVSPAGALWLMRLLELSLIYNVLLACFNLLPVPPLDGGRILVGILPRGPALAVARLERAGLFLVLGVIFLLPHAIPGLDPMGWLLNDVARPVARVLFILAGHDVP